MPGPLIGGLAAAVMVAAALKPPLAVALTVVAPNPRA